MNLLRSPEMQAKYKAYQESGGLDNGCVLCKREPLREFEHWKIVENIFPYDRIAATHHMMVPKRHARETDLTSAELQELAAVKESILHQDYDFLIEAAHKIKTVPAHFHLHLIVAKA